MLSVYLNGHTVDNATRDHVAETENVLYFGDVSVGNNYP